MEDKEEEEKEEEEEDDGAPDSKSHQDLIVTMQVILVHHWLSVWLKKLK